MSAPILNPRILGRAENAHRALLDHLLAGTGLTYQRWVVLSLLAGKGEASEQEIVDGLTMALKIDKGATRALFGALATSGLVEPEASALHLSDKGRALYDRVKTVVEETVLELYREIPKNDLEIAGRVLTQVTLRADTKLAELKRAQVEVERRND